MPVPTHQTQAQAIVIGCGVSGLSCGLRLLEAGHPTTIRARDLPPRTTSNVAAAIWYPYRAAPVERVLGWGQRSFEVFSELAGVPGTGVRMIRTIELFDRPTPDPWWRECVHNFRHADPHELPPGYTDAFVFDTPLIEMSVYLEYLMERFRSLGGQIVQRQLRSLDEALAESGLVVNCAGLGARTLAGDPSLFPIRGQIVRIEPPPTGTAYLDENEQRGLTYIVPRSTDCILGGTSEEGNWSLEPDMSTARAIIERAARLVPQVLQCRVVEHRVGLRPGRPIVRLEAEKRPDGGLVVHNYGHGGAGVTLSWGCAEEVVALCEGANSK